MLPPDRGRMLGQLPGDPFRRQEDLPPGWMRVESRSRPGSFYYAHPATRRTQMERPIETSAVPPPKKQMEEDRTDAAKRVAESSQASPPSKSLKMSTKEDAQTQQEAKLRALKEIEDEEAEKEQMLRRARERRAQQSNTEVGNGNFDADSRKRRKKKAWQNESDEEDEPNVTAEEIEKWSELEEKREREVEQEREKVMAEERKQREEQQKKEAEYEEALVASRRRTGEEQRSKQQAALELARQMVSERLQTQQERPDEPKDRSNNLSSHADVASSRNSNTVSFGSRQATRELKESSHVNGKTTAASKVATKDKELPSKTQSTDSHPLHETVRQANQPSKKEESEDECCVLDVKLVRRTWLSVGDQVRGKETGKLGIVTAVDAEGDPKVRLDGESQALPRFGKEFEVVQHARYQLGNRVLGKASGKLGVVVSVEANGEPRIKFDGEGEALQRSGTEFVILLESFFSMGDRVKGKESGKIGTVVSVDAEGDPKVLLDGESEPLQRFGHEFLIFRRAEKIYSPDR